VITPSRRSLVLGAALLASPGILRARAAWPDGPIRIVAPFPPGGSADLICRLVQQPLQQSLGVPVVIENRPGASGALGTAAVAHDPPDGRSFVLVFDSHVVNPVLNPTLGYDPEKDLRAVMLVATAPMLITTPDAKPFRTLADMVAAARQGADRVSFGTVGVGSLAHLTMERLQQVTGTQMVHVPYRGGGPMSTAAMAGEIDLAVASVVGLGGQVGTALRPLAQSGASRSPRLPHVPTIGEAGVAGVASEAFWGFCTRAGVADEVVMRFNAALVEALATPAVRQPLESQGCTVRASSPEEFGRFLAEQSVIWGKVVRDRHITAQ
jgi:tripartite-type tricarboxylate transporter receptor subunit TctC